jgi:hypothetical protein
MTQARGTANVPRSYMSKAFTIATQRNRVFSITMSLLQYANKANLAALSQ